MMYNSIKISRRTFYRLLQVHWFVTGLDDAQPFSYASYYESNMVLQRAPKRTSVWGHATTDDLGKVVHVNVSNDHLSLSYDTAVERGITIFKGVCLVIIFAKRLSGL